MAKYETRRTLYLIKGSVNVMVYVCCRMLDIPSEDLLQD